jgi:hypothetical protein
VEAGSLALKKPIQPTFSIRKACTKGKILHISFLDIDVSDKILAHCHTVYIYIPLKQLHIKIFNTL